MNAKPQKDKAHQAYPKVAGIGRAEHVGVVRDIFATIPGRYDFLNHLLSLRRDVAWRRAAVRRLRFFSTFRLLDIATGTADLAIEAARHHPQIRVTGVDFTPEMLAAGQRKIFARGLADRIRLLQADAMQLPFPDESFDAAAMAFGIRNMPDRLQALREMRRVLVPGGRAFILEMNFPPNRFWQGFFALYLKHLLPAVARLFSVNPAAYRYLGDSILHFPAPPAFLALMEAAGFRQVTQRGMTFGITRLYSGGP